MSQHIFPTPRTGDHDADARRAVLDKYARRSSNGRIQFCAPSRNEAQGRIRRNPGTDGKPIFPDLESAEAAARELEALGSDPMYAYLCERSKSGHHHIATADPARRRERNLRPINTEVGDSE